MKKYIVLFSFSVLIFLLHSFMKTSDNYFVIKKKAVKIKGQTTLGGFNCSNHIYKVDTLYFHHYKNKTLPIRINVAEIACGNKLLNKDLYKTLKGDNYPVINVELFEFKNYGNNYRISIDVDIVGKRLKYREVILLREKDGSIKGSIKVNLAQLGLETPKKIGGLVKMKDEVTIYFDLK